MSQPDPLRSRANNPTTTLTEPNSYAADEEKSAPADSSPYFTRPKWRRPGLTGDLGSLPQPVPNDRRGSYYGDHHKNRYPWWRLRRLLSRPLPWLFVGVIALMIWWSRGARDELKSPDVQYRLREMFPPEITKGLQFFPASNRKIHYVGRWTTAPNRMRIDGAFPGVYFDLNITNTSSVLLSLSNMRADMTKTTTLTTGKLDPTKLPTTGQQYTFSAMSRFQGGSPPISLLALVDEDEYIVLPNASSLVPIRMHDLNARKHHSVRIIAPMTDDDGQNVLQVEGLWLDTGGQLLPIEGTNTEYGADDEEDLDPESDIIGRKHTLGLNMLLKYGHGQAASKAVEPDDPDHSPEAFNNRRKLLEIVTDTPVHLRGRSTKVRSGGSDGLLAGVMGWEYLLGEMFSVDHVSIGVDDMCLTHDCIGGTGEPSGMGDVFFRSGPVDSIHFGHPWPFQSYAPDVLIMNLGTSDYYSIDQHVEDYNKTKSELFKAFEDTYVSLVKATRNLAYPNHPATIEMQRLGLEGWADNNAPASIPIFIMRPFNGEMEHATQGAVNRLRAEGDKGVYWLDTSGWLDPETLNTTKADFFRDPEDRTKRLHLTEHGNQKAAIYLHMHVCRYLARADEKCAFLPPEVYVGNVYDPQVATFDRYIEVEKERQMREIFWEKIS